MQSRSKYGTKRPKAQKNNRTQNMNYIERRKLMPRKGPVSKEMYYQIQFIIQNL